MVIVLAESFINNMINYHQEFIGLTSKLISLIFDGVKKRNYYP